MNVTEDEMRVIYERRFILRDETLREKNDAIDMVASLAEVAQKSGVKITCKSVDYSKLDSIRAIEAAECTLSLFKAIDEAGGGVGSHWLDMSLREFIARSAAQNYLRFVFDRMGMAEKT